MVVRRYILLHHQGSSPSTPLQRNRPSRYSRSFKMIKARHDSHSAKVFSSIEIESYIFHLPHLPHQDPGASSLASNPHLFARFCGVVEHVSLWILFKSESTAPTRRRFDSGQSQDLFCFFFLLHLVAESDVSLSFKMLLNSVVVVSFFSGLCGGGFFGLGMLGTSWLRDLVKCADDWVWKTHGTGSRLRWCSIQMECAINKVVSRVSRKSLWLFSALRSAAATYYYGVIQETRYSYN